MACRQLEMKLEMLDGFQNPKVKWEQYSTPPRIAAEMLHYVNMDVNLSEKRVLDLGCGCGTLGLGCVQLGATRVLGIDIDDEALAIAEKNRQDVGLTNEQISFLHKDVLKLDKTEMPTDFNTFDVVITNPPFGLWFKQCDHTDWSFIEKGLEFADTVYSVHKSLTKEFLTKKAGKNNIHIEFIMTHVHFPIERTYIFHKLNRKMIAVDVVKFMKKHP